ncbi:TPA: hypothetical protein ACGO1T_000879 [Streptococcus suis]
MSKISFVLRIATLLTLGLLMAGLIDNADRKDLNLTEVEQDKLEAGEPVQVSGWYQDELGHHAVYARLVDGEVVLYGVVKEEAE